MKEWNKMTIKTKESDWNLSPKGYLLLLELFIDWFYRLPTMTPTLIKQYLLANADSMIEEDILVINPKRTIEKTLLLAEKKTKK